MKNYTDLEQSKKLAEFLSLESADMWWAWYSSPLSEGYYGDFPMFCKPICNPDESVPCWSLAALLRLMPKFNMFKRTIECRIETVDHLIDKACEPIDAAFEMICWLKEHNKI